MHKKRICNFKLNRCTNPLILLHGGHILQIIKNLIKKKQMRYTFTEKIRLTPDSLGITDWCIFISNIIKSFNAFMNHSGSDGAVSSPDHNWERKRPRGSAVHLWETTQHLKGLSVIIYLLFCFIILPSHNRVGVVQEPFSAHIDLLFPCLA